MRKLLGLLLMVASGICSAQTFPVQNLTVNGISSLIGQSTFTASPVMPTPAPGDSSNKGATTAFLANAINGYATLFSPAFTGIPTAPTAAISTNSAQLATTAFVKAAGVQYPSAGIAIATNTTLTLGQLNRWAVFAGNSITATLPLVSTTVTGETMTFMAEGSNGAAIAGSGSDVIVSSTGVSANTLLLPAGQTVTVTSNGSAWYTTSTGKVGSTNSCQNIADFGGSPSATDNSAAFTLALTSLPVGHRCVYFGPGQWNFTSSLSYTYTGTVESVTVSGAGADTTQLNFPNNSGGVIFNYNGPYNSAHVRDLSITTAKTGVGSAAIALIQTQATIPNPAETALSDITNVTIRGSDGYAVTDYWSLGVEDNEVSNVNFTNLQVIGGAAQLGIGLQITGTASDPTVQFNIQGSMFNLLQFGVVLGTETQGVTINQSNFTANSSAGIVVPGSEVGMDQLTITNSQFASYIGISIASQYQNLMIANNLFIIQNIAGAVGISNSAAVLFTYMGNTFQNANAPTLSNNPTGIYVNNTVGTAGNITGNVFRYMSPAIRLDTSANAVNVQSNSYFNNNVNISNVGGANTCPASATTNCLGGGSQ